MNRPTTSDRKDDEEIRGWIAEAGDIRVETRPEYVDHVRHLLLDRVVLPPAAVIPPDEVETPLGIGLIRLFAVACVAAVALFAAVHLASRPVDAWAGVAQTLHDRPWIHIIATGPDGLDEESWISPRFEILARKRRRGAQPSDAEYHDVERGIKDEYIADEKTIYRDPEIDRRRKRRTGEIEVFRQLLYAEELKTSPLPGSEIIAESRRQVTERGKTWKVYELTIRWTAGRKPDVKMIIRVDPKNGLPQTWDISAEDGEIRQTLDYPSTGPADILALGVPASAKRENHLPDESLDLVLNQVLNGLKVGRNRFDDYCGYVWNESVTPANLRRVWRKGHKWRVEHVLPRMTTKDAILNHDRIPIGIDLAGLKQREQELIFEPQAICDGQIVWLYHDKPKPIVPDQPSVAEKESVSIQHLYALPDDPYLPWPDLLPEQLGHPNMDGAAQLGAHFIDPKPSDGPPGTLCLRVREAHFPDPQRPDKYRLWIDPDKNDLALRSEISVFEPSPRSMNTRTPTKVAYVETKILTDLARSPNGFWYPTRVLRKTSNTKVDRVTRFLLDFDVPIPDELFQPVK
jgi:hypothetical protein